MYTSESCVCVSGAQTNGRISGCIYFSRATAARAISSAAGQKSQKRERETLDAEVIGVGDDKKLSTRRRRHCCGPTSTIHWRRRGYHLIVCPSPVSPWLQSLCVCVVARHYQTSPDNNGRDKGEWEYPLAQINTKPTSQTGKKETLKKSKKWFLLPSAVINGPTTSWNDSARFTCQRSQILPPHPPNRRKK